MSYADISIFWMEISKFLFLTYFESLKISLINMVAILMMSRKMAPLGFLEIKVFWDKGFDVIICVNDVTSHILSRDLNYIIDVVMWPKFKVW